MVAVSGCGANTVHALWARPWSPNVRIGTLVRLAYALGVSPLELMPALALRPAGGPVRLGSDAACRAVLAGEALERVRAADVFEDRLPAPGELLRSPPPVFEIQSTVGAGVGDTDASDTDECREADSQIGD